MPDGLGGGKVAGVEGVGHQLEGDGAVGKSGGKVEQLFALGVFDPELAQLGADAVDGALEDFGSLAVAGVIDGELDGGRAAVENENGLGGHAGGPWGGG